MPIFTLCYRLEVKTLDIYTVYIQSEPAALGCFEIQGMIFELKPPTNAELILHTFTKKPI